MARSRKRVDDSTPWIGYADFLTTLVVLFFILTLVFAARAPRGPAYLTGEVRLSEGGAPLPGCLIRLGDTQEARTGVAGDFFFPVHGISQRLALGVDVRCAGTGEARDTVELLPGDTTHLAVVFDSASSVPAEDSIVTTGELPGDALFASNDNRLKPEGVDRIVDLARREFQNRLRPGDVIAVQGHTDDTPFPIGAGKDNWVLSGERAAAAARVLTDPAYGLGFSECQVAIMGFGPSRPVERVEVGDALPERERKRARNRRIVFRRFSGMSLTDQGCT